ncbi:Cuticle protein [Zootermopsis nevadensis]|uniref:Cuticle protein n=1 Tax=Zootermopsis nevadensis TaxID=136037 RepID=A0A067QWG0_ZOONE|nr:Cuticle protein [Zootermopsis nevadensis]
MLFTLAVSVLTVVRAGYFGGGPTLLPYAAAAPAYSPAYGSYVAPAAASVAKAVDDQYSPPHYSFSYGVNDPHTGDNKEHHETRSGDVVQGSYSLVDPDGTRRTVEYTADAVNGFNAVVHKTPAVAVAKVAAPAAKTVVVPSVSYGASLGYAATPASAYGAGYISGGALAYGADHGLTFGINPILAYGADHGLDYGVSPFLNYGEGHGFSYGVPYSARYGVNPALAYGTGLPYGTGHLGASNIFTKDYFR